MPVELKFSGDVIEVVHDLKRFVAPFMQAEAIATAMHKAAATSQPTPETQQPQAADVGATDGPDAASPATVREAASTQTMPPAASAAPSLSQDDPDYGKGANNPAASETVVAEPVQQAARRGRPRKGTVVEKGAAPTASEAIIPKFKVVYDDREAHFDDLSEAFEAMADHVEQAGDVAAIDAFMKANEWVGSLDEKHVKMVEVLNGVVKAARDELAKPVPATEAKADAPRAAEMPAEKPFPTLPAYTLDHARVVLRAMAADTANTVLNSDQLRNKFLVDAMAKTGGTKISEVPADKMAGFVEGIVQALSPKAIEDVKAKWAEVK